MLPTLLSAHSPFPLRGRCTLALSSLPDHPHPEVRSENLVAGDNRNVFGQRRRQDLAVEGIGVMPGESEQLPRMIKGNFAMKPGPASKTPRSILHTLFRKPVYASSEWIFGHEEV
jgi:hypothetical protein